MGRTGNDQKRNKKSDSPRQKNVFDGAYQEAAEGSRESLEIAKIKDTHDTLEIPNLQRSSAYSRGRGTFYTLFICK